MILRVPHFLTIWLAQPENFTPNSKFEGFFPMLSLLSAAEICVDEFPDSIFLNSRVLKIAVLAVVQTRLAPGLLERSDSLVEHSSSPPPPRAPPHCPVANGMRAPSAIARQPALTRRSYGSQPRVLQVAAFVAGRHVDMKHELELSLLAGPQRHPPLDDAV